MKPIQYLLVGFPYSGKTTLANELHNQLGFAQINIDQLKFNRGYTDVGDDDVPDKAWDEIFEEADTLIIKYLKEGKSIANEYAWMTKSWRERPREVAKKAGYESKIIYIQVSKETIYKRWQENSKSRDRFHWSEKELKQFIDSFEELSDDEDYIIYDQKIPVTEWIKKNL